MPFITPFGRFDRAAVVARAKEIHRADKTLGWTHAMQVAYREAKAQRWLATKVVAATTLREGEFVGEFVVCVGNALGPVIARFPRTAEGHRAALELAGGG